MTIAQSTYPQVTGTAPDSDSPTVNCPGCKRLTLQVSNQSVLITFARLTGGTLIWDTTPELYLPVIGSIAPIGGFDAFRYRAATPAARIPAGQAQAYVVLTPRT